MKWCFSHAKNKSSVGNSVGTPGPERRLAGEKESAAQAVQQAFEGEREREKRSVIIVVVGGGSNNNNIKSCLTDRRKKKTACQGCLDYCFGVCLAHATGIPGMPPRWVLHQLMHLFIDRLITVPWTTGYLPECSVAPSTAQGRNALFLYDLLMPICPCPTKTAATGPPGQPNHSMAKHTPLTHAGLS